MLDFLSDHFLFSAPADWFSPKLCESGRSTIMASWPIVCVDCFLLGLKGILHERASIGIGWRVIIQRTVRPILIMPAMSIFDDDLSFGQAVKAFRV